MAFDEGLAHLWREDLADVAGITEKKMFGGLCFLQHGHMLCGVIRDGGMARVGKPSMDVALALPGISPLAFTGRPMGGLVDLDADAMADDTLRGRVLELALGFVASLPPK